MVHCDGMGLGLDIIAIILGSWVHIFKVKWQQVVTTFFYAVVPVPWHCVRFSHAAGNYLQRRGEFSVQMLNLVDKQNTHRSCHKAL